MAMPSGMTIAAARPAPIRMRFGPAPPSAATVSKVPMNYGSTFDLPSPSGWSELYRTRNRRENSYRSASKSARWELAPCYMVMGLHPHYASPPLQTGQINLKPNLGGARGGGDRRQQTEGWSPNVEGMLR